MTKIKQAAVEVLAPAGSFAALVGAVNAGADAVYMGGTRFGARAYADNPQDDGLIRALDFIHLHGKRLYLTVNTLMKQTELPQVTDFLAPLYEAGLDGVLVQDSGAALTIASAFPDLPIHASTQMNVHGADHARWLKAQGFTRIVPAREMSLDEIRLLKEAFDGEIECFAHGALCYCYSGQCLFSSILGGRSGNRGRCAQPCRLPYTWSKKTAGFLSPKDLCTLKILPDLIEAGIDSLKIEGRMKRPEYAAQTSAIYRHYVDLYQAAGREGYRVDPADIRTLAELYSRDGFTEGYYHQYNGASMMATAHVGYGSDDPKQRQSSLESIASAYLDFTETDSLYGISNPKYPIDIEAEVRIMKDTPAILRLCRGSVSAEVSSDVPVPAKQRPLDTETVRKQILKTGGTPFRISSLRIGLDDGLYMDIRALNALRRDALAALYKAMLDVYRRPGIQEEMKRKPEQRIRKSKADLPSFPEAVSDTVRISKTVQISKPEQLDAVLPLVHPAGITRIILEPWMADAAGFPVLCEKIRDAGPELYISLPYIFREHSRPFWDAFLSAHMFDGLLVRNMESLRFAAARLPEIQARIQTDERMYMMNPLSRAWYHMAGADACTLPLELNEKELAHLCDGDELIVYGRIPLMITAGCVRHTTSSEEAACPRRFPADEASRERCFRASLQMKPLTDRKNMAFPVRTVCADCYNLIYNAQPLLLVDRTEAFRLPNISGVRYCLTDESTELIRQILMSDRDPAKAQDVREMLQKTGGYTRGHFLRGIL